MTDTGRQVQESLRCQSIDGLAGLWGCPPHHIEILWERGDLHGFFIGSTKKHYRRTSLRFPPWALEGKQHLAFGDFPEPPLPPVKKPPKPALPELTCAMLAGAKTKPPYEQPANCVSKYNYIYFIQCGEYVKIGYTTSVGERLKALRGMVPYPLKLLKVIEGMIAGERAVHKRLALYHHAYEWFRLEPDLLEAIKRLPGKRPHA